jgi:hypothetical protein
MSVSNKQKYYLQSRHIYNSWVAAGEPKLRTIMECAVGHWSLLQRFEGLADKTVLIEPDPKMAKAARERYRWAEVIEVAVHDGYGIANLRRLGGQSYIKGVGWCPAFSSKTPALKTAGKVAVATVPFTALDDGKIDVLNLDSEGCEWYVLKRMVSRPVLIQIELYKRNKYYKQICEWLVGEGYRQVARWGNANKIYEKV